MVVVREIVKYLLSCQAGAIETLFDNRDKCVRMPSFVWADTVEFTPGYFDSELAVFAAEVKGVRFLKIPVAIL